MDSAHREDLKRNELKEALDRGIHYAEDHARTIVWAVAAALGVALVGVALFLWWNSRRASANDLLAHGLRVYDAPIVATGARPDDPTSPSFASESARRDKARELFTALDSRFGGGRVGQVAKLYLAQIALAENDAERARRLWTEFLDDEPTGPLAATARVNLYRLDRDQGKSQAVADELAKMLEQADRPLPNDVILYQLALTYESMGKREDAAAAYRRIVEEHPQSPYFATAQQEAGAAPKGS